MNEKELELGRQFGAAQFYIYQVLKHRPRSSIRELEVETGFSYRRLKELLKDLYECNVITRKSTVIETGFSSVRGFVYYTNHENEAAWKLH